MRGPRQSLDGGFVLQKFEHGPSGAGAVPHIESIVVATGCQVLSVGRPLEPADLCKRVGCVNTHTLLNTCLVTTCVWKAMANPYGNGAVGKRPKYLLLVTVESRCVVVFHADIPQEDAAVATSSRKLVRLGRDSP